MEGKKIEKVLELGDQVVLIKFDDNTYMSAKILDPEIPADDIEEFYETASSKKGKKEPPVKEKEPPVKEKEPESSGDDITWADLKAMDEKKLKKLIEDNDLLTDPDSYDDDESGLRKAIAEECGIEIPSKKEPEKEPTPDDNYTWEDLAGMDYDELKDLCEEANAETDPADFEEGQEEKFRRAMAKEFGITAPPPKKK